MFVSPTSSTPRVTALAIALALLVSLVPAVSPSPARAATTVFINEIHYDNTGTDTGEAIEVAGPAGTDLTGWSIVLYNGATGASYDTDALAGVLPDQGNGYGTAVLSYPSNGIQNGAPDGIALVSPGDVVVQFLSYEGSFTAVGGPADGMASTDIGVSEVGDEPTGMSVQLTGTGLADEDFTWTGPAAASFGNPNAGQTFDEPPPTDDLVAWINEFHYDNDGTDEGEFIEVAFAEGTDLTGWSIVRYNGANGAVYTLSEPVLQETNLGALPVGSTTAGFSFVVVEYGTNGLQNGAPDGFALVDDSGQVVQFLSYEGSFTATEGPAIGESSEAIGVAQSGDPALDPVGASLQLTGTGTTYADFTWTRTQANTAGTVNTGQTLEGGDEEPLPPCDTVLDDITRISTIQGNGSATTLSGELVTRGVVTADYTSGGASGIPENQGLRGFFIEATSADRDADPATSEGIFVFDADGTFAGDVGDSVAVAGTPGEFFGVTQVSAAEVEICVEGEPAFVDPSGLAAPALLPLPTAPADRATVFEPLESMRVSHPELTVTEFFQVERFGEVRLSSDGVLQTPTNVFLPGSPERAALAAHNEAVNIVLDDGRNAENSNRLSGDLLPYVKEGGTLRIGDPLLDETFILHFGFGAWRLQPLDVDALTDELVANRTRPRPQDPPEVGGTLRVASFNVLNYFNGDGLGGGFPTTRGAVTASELERQTTKLVDAILRLDADVYGLIEIENDGGPNQAARTLVDALNAEAGPDTYRFVDTGVIGTDEIKQAFIYNRHTTRPIGDFALLTQAVDPRFNDDHNRPALAQTFLRLGSGERITVVVNHLKSKGSGCGAGDDDPVQGNCNLTRTLAAEALADWLATNPTGKNVIGSLIIGDLNSYAREDPIVALEDAGFEDQLRRFTEGTPYTFTFDGMQGTLDTALADVAVAARVTGAAVWHINADEVPAIDYLESVGVSFNRRFRTPEIAEAYFDPSAFRSSDHDPVVIGVDLDRSKYAKGKQPGR
jgi:predicted extracellular nuclease